MADYVANENVNEEESSAFNLAAIWKIIVLNWQWIVISTIVALGLAYCYLRYTNPVYTSSMKILIKDDDKKGARGASQMMNLENVGLFSNSNGFDNELEILRSTNINTRVVKALKLYVSYAIDGRVRKRELYKNNPLIVDMPESQLAVLQTPVSMEIKKSEKDGYIIKGEVPVIGSKEKISFERKVKKLPGNVTTPVGTIIIQQNPSSKMTSDHTLYARILPLDVAGRIYTQKLTASATSKTTTVAALTFTDTQVERSLDYLNELLKSYNEDANEDKNEVATKTDEFIRERLLNIRGDLDITESNLEQYKKNNDLINLTNDATNSLTKTTEYQSKQVELETQLNLISALVNYANNPSNAMQVIPANLGLQNQNLNQSISKYNEGVLLRNRLIKSSSEDNPSVQRITAELEEMWPSIRLSLEAIKNDLQTQKKSADSQFHMFNSRIQSTPTQERALTNIMRQQEIQANLYLMLLQKREENAISLASTAAKARIIDSPQYMGKVAPKSMIIWMIALILGFGFPIGVVLLLNLLRYQIEGREDIEKLTKIPILADIPLGNKVVDGEKALVVRENSNNTMEEAFRGLRTNLRFVQNANEKVICCTSCIPGEGKTFISTNLAMSIALMGKKVIIVGLDIRKPRLVKLFGIPVSKSGLTTFLSSDDMGYDLLESQITHSIGNPNLDVLPAGVIPPNPGELISRTQLDRAIELLKEHYDYIVLDTPPIGLVSDTLSIARVADVTLVVCRADYSPRSNFNLINNLNDNSKLPKVNLVLNGVDLKKKKYGYYYGYGKYGKYGYGYGKYGHYGIYGNYGNQANKEHTEK
ncbi:MAG: polysaccharide biosynthesis tyrosine autokinase [Bacteroidaceae bacterium]|nr:polysaccharide biosynthesis tyrosine autokinase [Bacteroidaceae bacterium]